MSRASPARRLLRMLEQRIDNVVFRTNFAASRNQARQFVRHGHVLVNGKRVTIPSYRVRPGDVISIGPKVKDNIIIRHNLDTHRPRRCRRGST